MIFRHHFIFLIVLLFVLPIRANENIDTQGILSSEQNKSLQSNLNKIGDYYKNIKRKSHQQFGSNEAEKSPKQQVSEVKQSTPAVIVEKETTQQSTQAVMGQRDPFAITTRMFGSQNALNSGYNFSPALNVKVPEIKLKAVMEGPSGGLAALIDMEGQQGLVVREGDTIGLDSGQPGNGLRIKKINRSSLVLTTGSLGGDIIIR